MQYIPYYSIRTCLRFNLSNNGCNLHKHWLTWKTEWQPRSAALIIFINIIILNYISNQFHDLYYHFVTFVLVFTVIYTACEITTGSPRGARHVSAIHHHWVYRQDKFGVGYLNQELTYTPTQRRFSFIRVRPRCPLTCWRQERCF